MPPGDFSNHAGSSKQFEELVLMLADFSCTFRLLLVDVGVLAAACARQGNHYVNAGFPSRGHGYIKTPLGEQILRLSDSSRLAISSANLRTAKVRVLICA